MLVGLVVLTLNVSACTGPSPQDWMPAEAAAAAVSRTDAPPMPRGEGLAGVRGQRIRNDSVGIQARWMLVPGDQPINDQITTIVKSAISDQAARTGRPYAPSVFPRGADLGDRDCVPGSTNAPAADLLSDPALGPAGGAGTAIVCDVVFAGGTILGQRIRQVSGVPGAIHLDTTTTLYADTATGDISPAGALWNDDAPTRLWSEIVDRMRSDGGGLSRLEPAPPDDAQIQLIAQALESAVFGAHGAVVVSVPPGVWALELAGLGLVPSQESSHWSVPAALARPLLSPFGIRVLDAAVVGAEFAPAHVSGSTGEPVDCDLVPCVALTYDDGPSDYTPGILDELAARGAHASFFVMGEKAGTYASVLRREAEEGHTVANHTWNHPRLTQLKSSEVQRQIGDTNAALKAALGHPATIFRPPYGDVNASVLKTAGMAAILWDVDTFDWQHPRDDVLVSRAVDKPAPGSIVLQHDIQEVTARTAGVVYDGLLDRGFTLVSVEQLFGGKLPASGVWRTGP